MVVCFHFTGKLHTFWSICADLYINALGHSECPHANNTVIAQPFMLPVSKN